MKKTFVSNCSETSLAVNIRTDKMSSVAGCPKYCFFVRNMLTLEFEGWGFALKPPLSRVDSLNNQLWLRTVTVTQQCIIPYGVVVSMFDKLEWLLFRCGIHLNLPNLTYSFQNWSRNVRKYHKVVIMNWKWHDTLSTMILGNSPLTV